MKPETPYATALLALMHRHGLDETRAAALLGVPVFTLAKWLAGTRAPSAAAVRLVDVLGTLEALAPAIFSAFLPPVSTVTPRKRGRVKNLAGESGHVEKSGLHRSTDSIDNSVMSKNPV